MSLSVELIQLGSAHEKNGICYSPMMVGELVGREDTPIICKPCLCLALCAQKISRQLKMTIVEAR